MSQSITTHSLGHTSTLGARIKAVARKPAGGLPGMHRTVPQGEGTQERNHCRAALELATELGWAGVWIAGGNEAGDGYTFVNIGKVILPCSMIEGTDWFAA